MSHQLDSSEVIVVETRNFTLRIETSNREQTKRKVMRARSAEADAVFEVDSGEQTRAVEQVHALTLSARGQQGSVVLHLSSYELSLLLRTLQKVSAEPYGFVG